MLKRRQPHPPAPPGRFDSWPSCRQPWGLWKRQELHVDCALSGTENALDLHEKGVECSTGRGWKCFRGCRPPGRKETKFFIGENSQNLSNQTIRRDQGAGVRASTVSSRYHVSVVVVGVTNVGLAGTCQDVTWVFDGGVHLVGRLRHGNVTRQGGHCFVLQGTLYVTQGLPDADARVALARVLRVTAKKLPVRQSAPPLRALDWNSQGPALVTIQPELGVLAAVSWRWHKGGLSSWLWRRGGLCRRPLSPVSGPQGRCPPDAYSSGIDALVIETDRGIHGGPHGSILVDVVVDCAVGNALMRRRKVRKLSVHTPGGGWRARTLTNSVAEFLADSGAVDDGGIDGLDGSGCSEEFWGVLASFCWILSSSRKWWRSQQQRQLRWRPQRPRRPPHPGSYSFFSSIFSKASGVIRRQSSPFHNQDLQEWSRNLPHPPGQQHKGDPWAQNLPPHLWPPRTPDPDSCWPTRTRQIGKVWAQTVGGGWGHTGTNGEVELNDHPWAPWRTSLLRSTISWPRSRSVLAVEEPESAAGAAAEPKEPFSSYSCRFLSSDDELERCWRLRHPPRPPLLPEGWSRRRCHCWTWWLGQGHQCWAWGSIKYIPDSNIRKNWIINRSKRTQK